MKLTFTFLSSRTLLETLGLVALLLLLAGTAFHFETSKSYLYYRELFSALFAALWLWLLLTRTWFLQGGDPRIDKSLFYLTLFPVLLVLWSLGDPGVPLYGATDLAGGVSEHVDANDSTLYVLRNALLYIPMVLYFSLRGLNEQELRLIALFAVLIAPFNVASYLQSGDPATFLASLGVLAEIGGDGVDYNSYVPSLTFPIICGLYLLFSQFSLPLKAIVLLCIVATGIFILLSTSRQSVIFVILSIVVFYYFTKGGKQFSKLIKFAAIAFGAMVAFSIIMDEADFHDNFKERFSSVSQLTGDSTGRKAIALNGLLILSPTQWFTGAGLTSVIVSGPHNDYIRWMQRVGVFVMLIGFMPFFIVFQKSYKLMTRAKQGHALYVFLCLSIGFILYHSLFGYPREDAFQAPYAYMGLALWFGALREGILNASNGKAGAI